MNIVAIIPARMESSRFPGKPLAPICGMPMIGHVYLRTRMAQSLSAVYVATCNREIADYVESLGATAIMTSSAHEGCVDRCAEAMEIIEKTSGQRVDVMLLVQGDEPLIMPEMIDLSLAPLLEDPTITITNLMTPINTDEEFADPNEVKVVVDKAGFALYFSREPIPSKRKTGDHREMFKQTCVIPFRREQLLNFQSLPRSPLENIESVDMLRLLENGTRIKMVRSDYPTYSVDTLEDLHRVELMMSQDALYQRYHDSGDVVV